MNRVSHAKSDETRAFRTWSLVDLSSRPKRTRISCCAAVDRASCAAFRKESRMKFANATELYRKSGVAKWRDLRFAFSAPQPQGPEPRSPLSSRPQWRDLQFTQPASDLYRSAALPFVIPSAAEGSAVCLSRTTNPNHCDPLARGKSHWNNSSPNLRCSSKKGKWPESSNQINSFCGALMV